MDKEQGASELSVEATVENLEAVNAFVEQLLCKMDVSMKTQMQLDLAVEELFVNIANCAYAPSTGSVTLRGEVVRDPLGVVLTFEDEGVPYDPLAKEDPDVSLAAEEREIGGLGIFLVKKNVDDIRYEHRDGKNILTIRKNLPET